MKHGSKYTYYEKGCRCDVCTAAAKPTPGEVEARRTRIRNLKAEMRTVEAEKAELVIYLRAENGRLQDLVNRALSAAVYHWRELRQLQLQQRKAS